ncbi:CDP-glucose 4,6-dehydratase, partial [Bacillus cereus]
TEKIINNGILYSGAWNFGPSLSNIVPIEKLVTSLLDIWGCGDWTAENIGPINFHEANLLNLDISKAKFNLNWQPKWSLQQTLENTIEWYKHYNSYTSSEMINLCISQIKQYCML